MRRTSDWSVHSSGASPMGLLVSRGTISSSTGSPGDASTRTRRQGTPPMKVHELIVDSTRTSIDSPGLITSVGYILIAGRSAAAQHGAILQGAAVGSKRPNLSSCPAGPVNLRPTIVQKLGRLSVRVNVPSPPDVAVSGNSNPAGQGLPPTPTASTDTRTFPTGPPT